MSLGALIAAYGYYALFALTFLQGESVMLLAGLAAHLGHLHLAPVILVGAAGTTLGDQLLYEIGARHGGPFFARRPSWKMRLERASRLVHAHRVKATLFYRFLYGFRTVIPFALGIARVPLRIFVPLGALGALLWAAAMGCGGYLFGQGLELLLGRLKQIEALLLSAVAAALLLFWMVRVCVRRWRARPAARA